MNRKPPRFHTWPWGLRFGAPILLLAALLGGCTASPAPLRIAFEEDLRTLDPHQHNEVITWSLLSNFFDALTRFDPEMHLQPALATHWEYVAPDHLRLYLRPDVRFHDGSPLTAADVGASLLRARDDPRSRIRHLLEGVRGVQTVGGGTVDILTTGASPTLPSRLALVFITPRTHAVLSEITAPVGSGAYRFVRRHSDGVIEAQAFAGWRGHPAVQRLEFSFVPDDGERLRRLLAGTTDVAVRLSPAAVDAVERRPGKRVVIQPRTAVQFLELNPAHASGSTRRALEDVRVRQALLAATNRQRYVNVAYRGEGAVATQYVHPVVFGFDPTVREAPFDPHRAVMLLAQAGVAAGELELNLGFGSASADLATLVAEDLTRLGVRLRTHLLPFPELMDRTASSHISLRLYGRMCTTGDAGELFDAAFHSRQADGSYGHENFSGYADPTTDLLLEAANRELHPQRRLHLLQTAQRRVLEALPILPLILTGSQTGIREGIEFTPRHDQWLDVASFRWR